MGNINMNGREYSTELRKGKGSRPLHALQPKGEGGADASVANQRG